MNPLVRQTKSKTTSGKFQRILSHIHGVVKNEHPKLSHVNKREGASTKQLNEDNRLKGKQIEPTQTGKTSSLFEAMKSAEVEDDDLIKSIKHIVHPLLMLAQQNELLEETELVTIGKLLQPNFSSSQAVKGQLNEQVQNESSQRIIDFFDRLKGMNQEISSGVKILDKDIQVKSQKQINTVENETPLTPNDPKSSEERIIQLANTLETTELLIDDSKAETNDLEFKKNLRQIVQLIRKLLNNSNNGLNRESKQTDPVFSLAQQVLTTNQKNRGSVSQPISGLILEAEDQPHGTEQNLQQTHSLPLNDNSFIDIVKIISQFDLGTVRQHVPEPELQTFVKTLTRFYERNREQTHLTNKQLDTIKAVLGQYQSEKVIEKAFQNANQPVEKNNQSLEQLMKPMNLSKYIGLEKLQPTKHSISQATVQNGYRHLQSNFSQLEQAQSNVSLSNYRFGNNLPFQNITSENKNKQSFQPIYSTSRKTQFQPDMITSQVHTAETKFFNMLEGENQPISFERFVKDFSAILERSRLIKNGQMQKLMIQLKPEQLGKLNIELIQRQNELVAKIISTTNTAKEMLETQIHALRQAFAQQNIQVTRIDIQTQAFADENQQFGEAKEEQSKQQDERPGDEQKENNEQLFAETLKSTLINTEI